MQYICIKLQHCKIVTTFYIAKVNLQEIFYLLANFSQKIKKIHRLLLKKTVLRIF